MDFRLCQRVTFAKDWVSCRHFIVSKSQYNGEDLMIAFNARFLIEMLSAAESDEITMELSTPTKAGIIKPTDLDENEELLMLVMPLMLNQ